MEKSRMKVLRKEESEPTLCKVRQSTYQVRKMLDIQKVTRPGSENKVERRIKTAMIKSRPHANEQTVHIESSEYLNANGDSTSHLKKPMTATGKRHQAPFGQYYAYNGVKNKSTSKPTTCTTHTYKNKYSVYHWWYFFTFFISNSIFLLVIKNLDLSLSMIHHRWTLKNE